MKYYVIYRVNDDGRIVETYGYHVTEVTHVIPYDALKEYIAINKIRRAMIADLATEEVSEQYLSDKVAELRAELADIEAVLPTPKLFD